MKTVVVRRAFLDGKATLGMLQVLGQQHDPIYTLENPKRVQSVDSSIPCGVYECRPYSGTKFKNVYEVMDVPNRTAILIHTGNTETDTSGCILVGLGGGMLGSEPAVLHSKLAMDRLRQLLGKQNFMLKIIE